jgi:hypothetical protein
MNVWNYRGPKNLRLQAICLAVVILTSNIAFADCQAMESQIQAELAQVNQQLSSSNGGICNMLRRAIPVYQRGLQFFQSCPAADPTGQESAAIQQTLQSMQQSAQAACAGGQ